MSFIVEIFARLIHIDPMLLLNVALAMHFDGHIFDAILLIEGLLLQRDIVRSAFSQTTRRRAEFHLGAAVHIHYVAMLAIGYWTAWCFQRAATDFFHRTRHPVAMMNYIANLMLTAYPR